ncbi:hypothetical protein [Cellulomonas sp. Root137]|uniref:hypothetical protein n=1 Tax=Cellulomonas sp. Root137 TaxID=1736459 RepID=UPI0006F542EB|nr:hypothetical protein [Cellulomonas sp. Root137]KQY46128.1 hypothetical protein ASD18_01185 [Cellulomonas sp. Root137]KRD43274.1 hypothetical protein ASE38_03135 [Cellulomonas sp. Root930]
MSESRRLPARVYWVRRLVVLGVVIALLALLGLLVAFVVRLFSGSGSPDDPAAAPTTSAASEPEPSQTPTDDAGVAGCAPAVLSMAMTPDAVSFAAGVSATFTVSITNTGTEACLLDAGEVHREILVTSGSDRVWSSRDCIVPGTEKRVLLLPAGGNDTTSFAWNRIRSAEGCPQGLPAPGAGTYSAQLTLAGTGAPPAVFGLG